MPLTGRDVAILFLLVCCVPFQHWLVQRHPVTTDQRMAQMQMMLKDFHSWFNYWFSINAWEITLFGRFKSFIKNVFYPDYSSWYKIMENDPNGECPAVEVWLLKKEWFGTSPKPRLYRPSGVKFRIGQVVKHNIYGYKGVIVGWDETCKAPESWIQQMHGKNRHWRDQPNYAVLVDNNDRNSQTTYVVQENLYPVKEQVVHRELYTNYFDHFDGAQYIPQPWLRAVFPLD